ncbi:MAG TPA: hypothetical protein VFN67_06360 [Polyangiales bacterium]|nr:hypothetical protein [Polyangiales bacterium]
MDTLLQSGQAVESPGGNPGPSWPYRNLAAGELDPTVAHVAFALTRGRDAPGNWSFCAENRADKAAGGCKRAYCPQL